MSVKDIKEPKKPRAKSAPRATTQETETAAPWRLEDDGSKVRNTKKLPYENKLNELFATISGTITLAGDQYVGAVIGLKGPELSYGYAKLAQENPAVKRVLSKILEGSAYADAMVPTFSVLLMVGWHYGFFIPDKIGIGLSIANGVIPVSREGEHHMREEAHRSAQEQAAREEEVSKPEQNGDGGSSSE